jgi:hypothetical protein
LAEKAAPEKKSGKGQRPLKWEKNQERISTWSHQAAK